MTDFASLRFLRNGNIKMKTWIKTFLFLLCTLLLSTPAHSAIVSIDDSIFGPDSITWDTNSSLEWLDVTKSLNRSYDDVSSQFGIGGVFEGWTYAGSYQLGQLISRWTGYPSVRVNRKSTEPYDEAFNLDGLIELLGATTGTVGDDYSRVRGITGSFWDSRYVWVGQISDFPENATDPVLDNYTASHYYTDRGSAEPSQGSFLVRYSTRTEVSVVPIPAAVWLMASALGLFGYLGRRKTNA